MPTQKRRLPSNASCLRRFEGFGKMRTCLECLPCLARNAIDLARKSAQGDAALEAEIVRSGMEILGGAATDGYPLPPPCYARRLIDNALAKSGGRVPDPWVKEKKRSTELALELMKQMGLCADGNCHNCSQATNANLDISALSASLREIDNSMSDFEKRLRLSVAGNILDFSIYADLDIAAAMETVSAAFTKPICGGLVGSRVPRDRGHAGRVPLPGSSTANASKSAGKPGNAGRFSLKLPPGVTIISLRRVAPGTRRKTSPMPQRASSCSNGAALSAPSSPPHDTCAPRSASQRATLIPLPPTFSVSTTSLNITPSDGHAGNVTDASSAGLMHRQKNSAFI